MAKKAKKRLEENEAAASFQFPVFDEGAFIEHELEQTTATGFALGVAVLLGVLSFAIDRAITPLGQPTLQAVLPLSVSIVVIALSPWAWQRVRPAASTYRRGDWAGLILLQLFGWLGLWFLLTDVFFRG